VIFSVFLDIYVRLLLSVLLIVLVVAMPVFSWVQPRFLGIRNAVDIHFLPLTFLFSIPQLSKLVCCCCRIPVVVS